jgi:hypothetical protein
LQDRVQASEPGTRRAEGGSDRSPRGRSPRAAETEGAPRRARGGGGGGGGCHDAVVGGGERHGLTEWAVLSRSRWRWRRVVLRFGVGGQLR